MSKYDTRYILYVLIGILTLSSLQIIPTAQAEWHTAELRWLSDRCTGQGQTLTLIEPDMNKNPKSTDTVEISVISDSDLKGITVKLKETGIDTGIFEGTVVFSFTEYSKEPLTVYNGDRITAKYQDATLPSPVFSGKLGISDTCIYTSGGPPVERAPAEDPRMISAGGNRTNNIHVDQQVQIVADLVNTQDQQQPFAYLVQIQNSDGVTISLSWISGKLAPGQNLSPSQSWVPTEEGIFNVQIYVWESIDNPDALSPPLALEVEVI